jgi:D-threo-aldose 1-dehydrogenase
VNKNQQCVTLNKLEYTMQLTQKNPLPRSALALTALGLGGAPIAGLYETTPEQQARATIDGAWDLGMRYFDTAPYYGFTLSERRFGEALRHRPRNDYVISSKVGRLLKPDTTPYTGKDWVNPLPFRPHYDYSYAGILRSHEDSLQRLGLGYIDILFVHDIGRVTHGDNHAHYWEQLTKGGGFKALEELRASGQVKAIGLGVNEWEIVYDSMQEIDLDCTLLAGRYTLLEQQSLSPFLEACVRQQNAIVIGGPFNSGVLVGNGKFNYADAPNEILERVAALKAVCDSFNVPLPAVALQFPMTHPAVVSAIPGGINLAQLQQNKLWFEQTIPTALWAELKQRGLIHEDSPVPV